MPISAEKMKRYPGGSIRSPEWLAFRASILDRAGNRCEGTPQNPECRASNGEPHPRTGGKEPSTPRAQALSDLAENDADLIDMEAADALRPGTEDKRS